MAAAPVTPRRGGPSEVIEDFLFVGNCNNACNKEQLDRLTITRILNITEQSHLGNHPGIETRHIQARDAEDEDISTSFAAACEFLESSNELGRRVLVHSIAGQSRSVSVVLAYLIRVERMTLSNAFALLKSKHPDSLPNPGFWKQLMQQEGHTFGKISTLPPEFQDSMTEFYEELNESLQPKPTSPLLARICSCLGQKNKASAKGSR